jgi:hypothetical protein
MDLNLTPEDIQMLRNAIRSPTGTLPSVPPDMAMRLGWAELIQSDGSVGFRVTVKGRNVVQTLDA